MLYSHHPLVQAAVIIVLVVLISLTPSWVGESAAFAGPVESTWPLSRVAAPTLLFGAPYADMDGVGHTHCGVDLAADPWEPVLAPVGGVVSFAGQVPSRDGQMRGVVTLDPGDGLLVSLSPVERFDVLAGETVGAGSVLGTLADSGDQSDPCPHLHVSAREDGKYIDPIEAIGLSGAWIQVGSPAGPAEPAGAPDAEPAPQTPSPVGASEALRPKWATSPMGAESVGAAPALRPEWVGGEAFGTPPSQVLAAEALHRQVLRRVGRPYRRVSGGPAALGRPSSDPAWSLREPSTWPAIPIITFGVLVVLLMKVRATGQPAVCRR